MDDWRSAGEWAEAAKAAGVDPDMMPLSGRRLSDHAKASNWPCRPRTKSGGGVEYHITALPVEARLLISRHELAEAVQAGRAEGMRAVLQETMDARSKLAARTAGLAEFMRLSPAQQREAEAKAAVIDACAAFVRRLGLPAKRGTEIFATEYSAGRIPVEDWVRDEVSNCCRGSIENWRRELDRHGLSGLAAKYGQHRKGAGKIDSNPAMKQFLLGMLVDHPHAGAGLVMKGLRARFDADEIPDLRSVQRWLKTWKEENEQVYTAVVNPDSWRSKFQAAGGDADAHIVRINQRWELDSTKADLMLADGQRHVIVGVIDVFTRRMKLLVSRSSSAAAVAAVLRRALLDWGVLEQAGTDNGSDYVSRHIKRVFAGLGVDHDVAPPFTPEHKPFIERGLGTFSHDLVELCAGYIGHSVAERKDIEARRSFAQRLMRQGETVELRMTPDELQQFCDEWTENVYGIEPHSSLKGKSPFEMAASWTGPVPTISDERALDVLLAEAPGDGGFRTITKKGLRIDNALFEAPALGGLEGSRVKVLLDEADIGRIYVFDEDGDYVCTAECPERTGISRKELASARKAHQKKVVAEEKAALKAAAKAAGTKDIVREIRIERAEAAGKLARLPHAKTVHSTPALTQAGKAARHGKAPAPTPVSAAQQARIAQLEAELAAPASAEVVQLNTKTAQFSRAVELERRLAAGEAVAAADRRWLDNFRAGPVYRSRMRIMQEHGLEAALAV
ncbi:Mu transposase C-terminal domain-containing protein [Paramagnetospirillum magneticum]|uniref:Transposase and inactivated derivative n=1 Tax=Paramagnetospirillum magneticum (strain ATCC 700264 / AMB-1) TaxID=342108 RepID=Q2WA75_PARM1|nr:Mu transposase C-terminal domain-containing protein [Paramagnetospirillum magneticum]BAE49250.1 Transposase and inactivated derivative [Paramagnetospirillum magneticum AMB-1]